MEQPKTSPTPEELKEIQEMEEAMAAMDGQQNEAKVEEKEPTNEAVSEKAQLAEEDLKWEEEQGTPEAVAFKPVVEEKDFIAPETKEEKIEESHLHGGRHYSKEEEEEIYGFNKETKETQETKAEKGPRLPERFKMKSEREIVEERMDLARKECADALYVKEKAEKDVKKLSGIRGKFGAMVDKLMGKPQREGEKEAVKSDAAAWEKAYKIKQDALKVVLKEYRLHLIEGKKKELHGEELEKYAKEVAIETSVIEAKKIFDLKEQKAIENMGSSRKWINEKAIATTDWYRKLPIKTKLLVSGGLLVGGVAAGAVGGVPGAIIMSGAFVGRTSMRILGGMATTAGTERLIKIFQERGVKKEITKNKEFADDFVKSCLEKSDKLDDKMFELLGCKKNEKTRRYILAGTLGGLVASGAMAKAFSNLIPDEWKHAVGRHLSSLVPDEWKEKIAHAVGGGAVRTDGGKITEFKPWSGAYSHDQLENALNNFDKLPPLEQHKIQLWQVLAHNAGRPISAQELESIFQGQKIGAISPEEMQEIMSKMKQGVLSQNEIAKIIDVPANELTPLQELKNITHLPIGTRGPEGAIIDYLKANPEVAKSYGWSGKVDLSKWSGIKAHELWEHNADAMLVKPETLEQLAKLGYPQSREGLEQMMRHINKGFVDFDPKGGMSLHETTYFRVPVSSTIDQDIVAQQGAPIGPENAAMYQGSYEDVVSKHGTPAGSENATTHQSLETGGHEAVKNITEEGFELNPGEKIETRTFHGYGIDIDNKVIVDKNGNIVRVLSSQDNFGKITSEAIPGQPAAGHHIETRTFHGYGIDINEKVEVDKNGNIVRILKSNMPYGRSAGAIIPESSHSGAADVPVHEQAQGATLPHDSAAEHAVQQPETALSQADLKAIAEGKYDAIDWSHLESGVKNFNSGLEYEGFLREKIGIDQLLDQNGMLNEPMQEAINSRVERAMAGALGMSKEGFDKVKEVVVGDMLNADSSTLQSHKEWDPVINYCKEFFKGQIIDYGKYDLKSSVGNFLKQIVQIKL